MMSADIVEDLEPSMAPILDPILAVSYICGVGIGCNGPLQPYQEPYNGQEERFAELEA